jgi:hypothetical protein
VYPLFSTTNIASPSFNSSSDLSLEPTNQPAKPNRHKALSVDDILHEFGLIERVSYTLFQIKQSRTTIAVLPLTFLVHPRLYDYFILFFTPDLFRAITTNTNRYTNMYRIHIADEGLRE